MNKILITFFTVLFCLTSSVGYSQNIICEYTGYTCPEVKFKDLVKQDGLFYMKFTQVPFNGKVKGQIQGSFRNGKKEGSWVWYKEDGTIIKGKVGELLSIEDGQQAAEFSCINILSQLKAACNGDLNIVNNCLKISGFVNSTSKFIDQPKIINPASELIVKIFGDKGKHTRIAVSVNSLPLDACVEIDAIFEIN